MIYYGAPNNRTDCPVLVLFDFPTYREETERMPLSNRSEREIFAKLIREAGFDYDNDVCICSLSDTTVSGSLSSMTPKKAYELGANLRQFIDLAPRKLIIAFGARAIHALGVEAKPMAASRYSSRHGDIPVVLSRHSYLVLANPDKNLPDVQRDLRFAHQIYSNEVLNLNYERWDIDEPKKIDLLAERIADTSKLAWYDHETSDLNYSRPQFKVVSTAFDWDERNSDDIPIVAFWWGWHNLVARYDPATMNEFVRKWREFYNRVGIQFDLGGHNTKFDDRATHSYFGCDPFRSVHDTRNLCATLNSELDNGLKTNVERYCAIPRYDDEVDGFVNAVAGRRIKSTPLTEDIDIQILKEYGYEPIEKVSRRHGVQKFWNQELDRKTWAWGLLPEDTLVHYNCLDALLTRRLAGYGFSEIQDDKRWDSYIFRMRMDHETRVPEDNGLLLDRKQCEDWVKQCHLIENKTRDTLDKYISENFPNSDIFYTNKITAASPPNGRLNPNSPNQVCAALFGEPAMLPTYDVDRIAEQTINLYRMHGVLLPWFDKSTGVNTRKLRSILDSLHREVYQIISKIEPGESPTREHFTQDYEELRRIGPTFEPEAFSRRLRQRVIDQYGFDPIMTTIKAYPFGLAVPQIFTKTGNPSTKRADVELLYRLGLGDPDFLKAFITYRRANKTRTSFLEKFLSGLRADGTVAPGYNVTGARGGRISSSAQKNIGTGFNGQNLNKNVRGLFLAKPGKVIFGWDLGQIEVRVLAAISGDERLLAAVRNTQYDIHRMTTADILGIPPEQVTKAERQIGKLTVFAVLYGVSASGLAALLGITVSEAEIIIENFFTAYSGVRQYMIRQEAFAREHGYVESLLGTRRWLRNIHSIDRGEQGHAARVASNAPIQGTAGEFCFDRAFAIMDDAELLGLPRESIQFWAQVHDYAGFEMDGQILDVDEEPPADSWAWCRRIRGWTTDEEREAVVQELKSRNANFDEEDLDYEFGGRILDVASAVFNDPNIWKPLDSVPILYDPYIKPYWDTRPNLLKAVDANYAKEDKRLIPHEVFATLMGEEDDDDEPSETFGGSQGAA